MTRKEERVQAFTLIFEKIFNPDSSIDELIANADEADDIQVSTFAKMLAQTVYENRDEIDTLISEFSVGWKIERIPKVSLAILRLALGEILFVDSIPVSVSINEAVELAKTFASGDDASYINGILGSIAKRIES
ncbi:MAG: transcription antitermination factor NusB [Clostridiales bacterium]|nr:transcription antitermination factor NusB [Clostridia bacterium]MCR4563772.1 transcription antitermination factor NusB [Clostridiales bacterium]